jgi:hypothetical protein
MLNGNEPGTTTIAERSEFPPGGSYLVADCGRCTTTVSLFDLVDGRYRLIAQGYALSTGQPPWSDLARSVRSAIEQITRVTGRLLLNEKGGLLRPARKDGSGVDYFGLTFSAAASLRTLVAGLLDDVSVASARRVLETNYATEVDLFSLSDTRGQAAQIESLVQLKPHLVFMTGGTEGGADAEVMKLAETIAIGLGLLDDGERPIVVYAGNERLRPRISLAFDELADVQFLPNLRPDVADERLDEAIRTMGEFYAGQWAGLLPGAAEIQEWSNFPVTPTAHAFAAICEYLAATDPVLGLDLGGGSATVVSATRGRTRLFVRSDRGLGKPLGENPDPAAVRTILAGAPAEISESRLRDYARNRALRPCTVPLTEDDLNVEQVVMQGLLRQVVKDAWARWKVRDESDLTGYLTILLRGRAFSHAPRPADVLLTVLDALQFAGIYRVVVDHSDTLPALGLLATYAPELVVQVLERDALRNLGWVVAPTGEVEVGSSALRVRLEAKTMETLHTEVAGGTVEVIPLPPGQSASVTLYPGSGLDIGAGPSHSRKVNLSGSALGIVVDARGRPLGPAAEPGRAMLEARLKAIAA